MTSDDHSRVIIHVDIDAFYAQVEEITQPELKTKPLGVYQKTIIVTSNYVARDYGIKKCMLTTEAIKLCPNLVLVNGENLEKYRQVSQDITKFIQAKYRVPVEKLGFDENFVDISKLVEEELSVYKNVKINPKYSGHNEGLIDEDDFSTNPFYSAIHSDYSLKEQIFTKRKSDELEVDQVQCSNKKPKLNSCEMYSKTLPNVKDASHLEEKASSSDKVVNDFDTETYKFSNVIGHVFKNKKGICTCGCINRITIGTHIANNIRKEIFQTFNLTLSAGISYNKLLAKLVSSLHKPNQQTVLFPNAVLDLMHTISLRQIPGIGSKMYDKLVHNLNIKTVEDLQNTSKVTLCKELDATTAEWLTNVSYGKDSSKVKMFNKQSSIGVEDRYYKPITNLSDFKIQSQVLLVRLMKLIKKDARIPRLLKINLRFDHFKYEFKLDSKQCQINSSVFSSANDTSVENYLLNTVVKMYKELCTKRNSYTVTYVNIAVGNFIDIADSQNSILKFCQKNTHVPSSEKHSEINSNETVELSDLSRKSNDDHTFFKESYFEVTNNQLPAKSQDEEASPNNGNAIHKYGRGFNPKQTTCLNEEANSSIAAQIEHSNTLSNTLNIDEIDRNVLNELPDDIRKEIEIELNRQRTNVTQSTTPNKVRNVLKNSTAIAKKKTVRQLSMLNFVERK